MLSTQFRYEFYCTPNTNIILIVCHISARDRYKRYVFIITGLGSQLTISHFKILAQKALSFISYRQCI